MPVLHLVLPLAPPQPFVRNSTLQLLISLVTELRCSGQIRQESAVASSIGYPRFWVPDSATHAKVAAFECKATEQSAFLQTVVFDNRQRSKWVELATMGKTVCSCWRRYHKTMASTPWLRLPCKESTRGFSFRVGEEPILKSSPRSSLRAIPHHWLRHHPNQ